MSNPVRRQSHELAATHRRQSWDQGRLYVHPAVKFGSELTLTSKDSPPDVALPIIAPCDRQAVFLSPTLNALNAPEIPLLQHDLMHSASLASALDGKPGPNFLRRLN
ncbi:MAG TPA: hypothetical protein V6D14_22235 [Coleofasciculaceae cyanobacterium]